MRKLILSGVVSVTLACGGSSGTPTNPTPTPTPQANRPPTINSMTFSPSFGIMNLTAFAYGSAASDPDGDTVTYSWNIAGNTSTSASGQITFANGGNGVATLTISDGKGGSANDSRQFIVGTMAGTWSGTLIGSPFIMVLAQPTGGVITGTWSLPGTPFSGQLDPAALNRIDGNANVSMRIKVTAGGGPGGFSDFTFTGTMDSSGTRLTGAVNGSGFTGQPLTLTK
jgi:immune inhibitor A